MKDFKSFIFHNNISQKDVIEYLGVSKGYMSLVISGKKKLSEDNFRKLLENPYSWDVSMLTDEPQPQLVNESGPSLTSIEALLRDMLAEERARVEALNEMIWELKAENARLQEQLRIKGGAAADAEDSLSATA